MSVSQSQSMNISETGIKEQLYILYLEIKGEIMKKNIEIDKDQFDDYVSNSKINTLVNYIKELIYILINYKFPNIEKPQIDQSSFSDKDKYIQQLESHIKKLEFDLRHYLQREFQNKIQKDALEMKLRAYMEIENDYEELKEKVKYEEGKFLNNERKDNEIIIIRQENSTLKKEISKNEEINKKYIDEIKNNQDMIKNLKQQIAQLTKKVSKIENNTGNPNTNSSINININNNGGVSPKWIIKQTGDECSNSIGIGSNSSIKKNNNNCSNKKFSKYYNLNIGNKMSSFDPSRGFSGFQTLKNKNHNGASTLGENNVFTASYNKILNNINLKNTKTRNKKESKSKHQKYNSVSMCKEDYEKSELGEKYISSIGSKYKFISKNNGYNKIMSLIPNAKFPLSSKHQQSKNISSSLPKKYLHRDKSSTNHSSLNIRSKN